MGLAHLPTFTIDLSAKCRYTYSIHGAFGTPKWWWLVQNHDESMTSWWLSFNPIWKTCASQIGWLFPRFGEKNVWVATTYRWYTCIYPGSPWPPFSIGWWTRVSPFLIISKVDHHPKGSLPFLKRWQFDFQGISRIESILPGKKKLVQLFGGFSENMGFSTSGHTGGGGPNVTQLVRVKLTPLDARSYGWCCKEIWRENHLRRS